MSQLAPASKPSAKAANVLQMLFNYTMTHGPTQDFFSHFIRFFSDIWPWGENGLPAELSCGARTA